MHTGRDEIIGIWTSHKETGTKSGTIGIGTTLIWYMLTQEHHKVLYIRNSLDMRTATNDNEDRTQSYLQFCSHNCRSTWCHLTIRVAKGSRHCVLLHWCLSVTCEQLTLCLCVNMYFTLNIQTCGQVCTQVCVYCMWMSIITLVSVCLCVYVYTCI